MQQKKIYNNTQRSTWLEVANVIKVLQPKETLYDNTKGYKR